MGNIGHNGGPVLPDDIAVDPAARLPNDTAGATRVAWAYYRRLMEHRKFLAQERTQQANAIADKFGIKPKVVRQQFRLARATPEKRGEYFDGLKLTAGLFGWRVEHTNTGCENPELLSALEVDKWVHQQQEDCTERMRLLQTHARARGVDMDALAAAYNLDRTARAKDGTTSDPSDSPASDWLDRIDAIGAFVGAWKI
jgi:hypothetical protein